MLKLRDLSEDEAKKILKRSLIGISALLVSGLIIIVFFGPKLGAVFGFFSKYRNDKVQAPTAPVLAPRFTNLPEAINQDSIEVKGFANPGAEVKIYVNGPEKGTTIADLAGEFRFENISLIKGRNTVFAKATLDGKESDKTQNFYIIQDKDKPKLDLKTPKEGETIKNLNNRILFTGKINEKAKIYINQRRAIQKPDLTFEYYLGTKEGEVKVKIEIVDEAGNKTEKEFTLRYEKTSN